jgi:hypothetical protein
MIISTRKEVYFASLEIYMAFDSVAVTTVDVTDDSLPELASFIIENCGYNNCQCWTG